jgi:hypothetical protein
VIRTVDGVVGHKINDDFSILTLNPETTMTSLLIELESSKSRSALLAETFPAQAVAKQLLRRQWGIRIIPATGDLCQTVQAIL